MSHELNEKFIHDPIAFMKKYPVEATGNIEGNTGIKLGETKQRMESDIFYSISRMHDSRRLAYLDMNKHMVKGGQRIRDLVAVSGQYQGGLGLIKSFFLPWRDNYVVSLTIPAMGTDVRTFDTKFFFTAAISGCSVFVKGDPKSPTILHAGGDTKRSVPAEAATFWRDMVETHAPTMSQTIGGEINKMHYVSDGVQGKTTEHSRTYEAWLKENSHRDLKIEDVAPTGCVMGIRADDGNWAFYLQENVTIMHHTFSRPRFGIKKVKGATSFTSRPLTFRKFYPDGLGAVTFNPAMPKTLSK